MIPDIALYTGGALLGYHYGGLAGAGAVLVGLAAVMIVADVVV